jgi:hypothetical protein
MRFITASRCRAADAVHQPSWLDIALRVGGLGNSLDSVNDEHFAKRSTDACTERAVLNRHAARAAGVARRRAPDVARRRAPDVARRRPPGVARRRPPGDDGIKISTKPTDP